MLYVQETEHNHAQLYLSHYIKAVDTDTQGRWVIVDLSICGTENSVFNIYAPNLDKQDEQTEFWTEINDYLDKRRGSKFIIGGDMNVISNGALDKSPSNTKRYALVEKLKSTLDEYKIVNIWRMKNPEKKGYSC